MRSCLAASYPVIMLLIFGFTPTFFPPEIIQNKIYRKNAESWDRQACANSVDPDQVPQKVISDQGLPRLSFK